MKKKKNIIIITISTLVLIGVGIGLFFLLNDKNKLTILERNWINDNINTVQNINIINDGNVFGKNGSGVFYNFLDDFSKEYSLKINPITYNIGDNTSGISFGVKNEVSDNDLVFYEDHYVIIGKNEEVIPSIDNLSGKTIGILSNDLSYVSKYITKANNITFKTFDTVDDVAKALSKDLNYAVVPLMQYLDKILMNNRHVIYHLSDVKIYYTMQQDDSYLSRILAKFYHKWEDFDLYFNSCQFTTFKNALEISDTDIDAIRSVAYKYGFVNTSPYEVIMGGKYGGIVGVFLRKFSDFSKIEFNFVRYKNFNKFTNAIEKKEIDLYFNYYNFTDNYHSTNGIPITYTVALRRDNHAVVDSVYSLLGKTVYVRKDSLIYDYLKNISGIKIETFSNQKELFKLNKKDVYLVIDKNTFDYYSSDELSNYTARFSQNINGEYHFKTKENDTLYRLLNAYMDIIDNKETILEGLNNHYDTVKTGVVMSKVAEYIIYLVIIAVIVILIIIRNSKRITIAKKIRKDDKLKFIDQLTSLKNRNFLNENISIWNNNTIYPQTIIVIDLNKIQEINDIDGYNEGDKQIKMAANVLIKTQLDNSEVMRTDGNEFVIYLVGYSQKQVTNYIHKLTKEFKKLPYEHGAEIGYSMIVDDIKTIEDALNEAVDAMKKQKSDGSEKKAKK